MAKVLRLYCELAAAEDELARVSQYEPLPHPSELAAYEARGRPRLRLIDGGLSDLAASA